MAFKMKLSKDQVEGMEILTPGQYEVRLMGFKPQFSKDKGSINLRPELIVVNNSDLVNRRVFDTLNSKAFYFQDFSHAFGIPLETDGKEYWLAGEWDGDKQKYKEDDPTTWVYKGPLLNRIAKIEVGIDNYQGKDQNKIIRYFCAISDCATKFPQIKHSDNLNRKKSD